MHGPWGPPPVHRPPSASVVEGLGRVYADVEAALAPVTAACRACGRCCRFAPGGGIVLFASAVELAYLVAEAGVRQPGTGPREQRHGHATRGEDLPHGRAAPDSAWRCPYQEGDLCGARGARLLGCRTYFCEAEARAAGERVYAEAFGRIQRLSETSGLVCWYGPARDYPGL